MRSFERALGAAICRAIPVLVLAAVFTPVAEAQIWVVTEPDGSQRFTSQPEPGARVFMRTRYGARVTPALEVPFGSSITSAARTNGLEPELVTAVIAAESNFDPRALSHKGAQGLMQLMPATAAELGVRDVWDPEDNIHGGSSHLARLLGKYQEMPLAIAAYNAGEGAVDRHGGIPPFEETRKYVQKVLTYYESYKQGRK